MITLQGILKPIEYRFQSVMTLPRKTPNILPYKLAIVSLVGVLVVTVIGGVYRKELTVSLVGVLVVAVIASVYRKELIRVYNVNNLFESHEIVENFRSMETMFDTSQVRRGRSTHDFECQPRGLPQTYEYNG